MEQYGIEASIDQLISETMLQENCVDKTVACIIAFLPNIYDSSAEQRNGYIKELVEVIYIITYYLLIIHTYRLQKLLEEDQSPCSGHKAVIFSTTKRN